MSFNEAKEYARAGLLVECRGLKLRVHGDFMFMYSAFGRYPVTQRDKNSREWHLV